MSIDVDYENPWIYNGVPFDGSLIGDNLVLFITLQISQTNDSTLAKVFLVVQNTKRKEAKSKIGI